MARERGLLRFAGDHPKHGIALDRERCDPGQCGDLLRNLLDRVTVARLFGEKKDNLPRFVVTPWRAIGSGAKIKRLRERDAIARLGQAIPQRCAERSISGD